jgi:hypothetical protein
MTPFGGAIGYGNIIGIVDGRNFICARRIKFLRHYSPISLNS